MLPLGSKIIVKQDDIIKEDKKSNLIIGIDDGKAFKKPNIGNIIGVGPKVKDKENMVPGARVFFSSYAGVNMKYEGEVFVLLNENEIFGFLAEGAEIKVGDTHDTEGLLQSIEQQGLLSGL